MGRHEVQGRAERVPHFAVYLIVAIRGRRRP